MNDLNEAKELNEEKIHAILVEKLAFLIHTQGMLGNNMLKEMVEKWNREDIKDTPYGKWLFNIAENFSRLKLKE